MRTRFTAEQCVAFSFTALVQANAPWRDILIHRLSLTEPSWDPASQLFGSLTLCFAKLDLHPGSNAALGFAALTNPDGSVNEEDARRKEEEWRRLLANDTQTTTDDT